MPQAPATNTIGSPFIELQSVDSTNNYARRQIHAGLAQHGQAFFAFEQLAGRGQRGKSWSGIPGANIAVSIIIDPQPLRLDQQFQLSACVAVAVHQFFCKYGGGETKIKWPNDLYWQDRKAGGILIESVVRSQESEVGDTLIPAQWDWSIVGVGININQTHFPSILSNPVSLKQITGKDHPPAELAKELCRILDTKFSGLKHYGFEKIYSNYLDNLYKKGDLVRFKKDNRTFEAIIKTVTASGKLVVQHNLEEEFDFGEVEWIISPTSH